MTPLWILAVAAVGALGFLTACGGEEASPVPDSLVSMGPFFLIEDDHLPFDQFPALCETETVDDGTLLRETPFESRLFPDWTRVHLCKEDGHVTGAVVLSSPGFRRYEFLGPPVIEAGVTSDREFTLLEVEGMPALAEVIPQSEVPSHDTNLYVIEQFPEGDTPGRIAEVCCLGSIPEAVCFMKQIVDLAPPGPCTSKP